MSVDLSVIIPTYNASGTIQRCLASLTPAARAGVEVLVVDDGSSDGTLAAVAAWQQFPVSVLAQPHSGVCAARNVAAEAATGTFLSFVDADDEVLPGWHEFYYRALAGGVALACCGMRVEHPDGRAESVVPSPMSLAYGRHVALFMPGAYAVQRAMFLSVGGFAAGLGYGEHHELGLRLSGRVGHRDTAATGDVLVLKHHDRTATRVAQYLEPRLQASESILRRHAALLRDDAQLRGDYHATCSHLARCLGDRRKALRHARAAIAARPLSPRNWARLARLALRMPAEGSPS